MHRIASMIAASALLAFAASASGAESLSVPAFHTTVKQQPAQTRATQRRQAPDRGLESTEELLRFIDDYRLDPQPDRVTAAVRSMSRLGLLRDPEKSGLFVGFVAGVLSTEPKRAKKLVSSFFPLPPQDQSLIILALAYSGLPDWKAQLTAVVERMPARKILIRQVLYDKEQGLFDKPLEKDLAMLDTLWGYHLATGSEAAVRRIITALAWTKETESIDKLTMAGVAKWTLATNAQKERNLLRIYRDTLPNQPKHIATELRDVIKAAEAFETARIRKDSLAAIEDLRRRNPTESTKYARAANIGSVAVAIGCVALAAAGQAQFGIPCVVTGAVTQGAAKLLQGWQ